MSSILELGKDYVFPAIEGRSDGLRSLFVARRDGWGKPFAHEETFTVTLFADLEEEIESPTAFELIATAVEIAKEQENDVGFSCSIELLHALARATHTTEVPPSLRANAPMLRSKSEECAISVRQQLLELFAHYRNAA